MAEEVEIDQAVYDQLIAEGKSERIARAKAKAAAVKKAKVAAGETLGPKSFEEQKARAGIGGGGAAAGAGVAVAERDAAAGTGRLTAEERQQRVAAALAARLGDEAPAQRPETRFAGQQHTHRLLAMVPPAGI